MSTNEPQTYFVIRNGNGYLLTPDSNEDGPFGSLTKAHKFGTEEDALDHTYTGEDVVEVMCDPTGSFWQEVATDIRFVVMNTTDGKFLDENQCYGSLGDAELHDHLDYAKDCCRNDDEALARGIDDVVVVVQIKTVGVL